MQVFSEVRVQAMEAKETLRLLPVVEIVHNQDLGLLWAGTGKGDRGVGVEVPRRRA